MCPLKQFSSDKIAIIVTRQLHVGKNLSGSDVLERHEDKLLAGHNKI